MMKNSLTYDKAFKERAVKLSYQRGSVLQAAKELGICDSSLGKWRKDFKRYGDNSFPGHGKISAYRKYVDKQHFNVNVDYVATPHLNNSTLILVDPMLATGNSMELSLKALLTKWIPEHIHIVAIIASKVAVEYIKNSIDNDNVTLWPGVIDSELDDYSYITPGLGDAGDLAYGEKL